MIWRDIFKVWLPVLLLAALLAGLYLLFEQRYSRLNEVGVRVLQIQERQKLLSRLMQLLVDAETGQRGFLLTEQAEYLDPLLNAAPRIRDVLQQLGSSYQRDGLPLNPVIELGQLSRQRFEILEAALRHYVQWRKSGTAPMMQASGKQVMDTLRQRIQELETMESERFVTSLSQWQKDLRTTRWSMAGATLLNLLLIVALGSFLLRDLNRRSQEAAHLKRMVDARTQELLSLSNHLQEVTEREKQSLARELHDSLGSLLVATKMDVAWLHARLRSLDPDLELRWSRIQDSLDRGVDLKRRVVESLRPTLLDNMGLYSALRWQFDETCARNNIKCTHRLPGEELQFTNDAAIALFRVAQESFTNILRHSAASEAELEVVASGSDLVMTITDNGQGFSPGDHSTARHGLAGMRHRVNALGGVCEISRRPEGGTRVKVTVLLANVVRAATEAEVVEIAGVRSPPDYGSQAGTSTGG
jgi:signal transduction histidine kinase